MRKCARCNGKGYIGIYREYNNGVCYNCNGDGYLFESKEKKDEFYSIKYLFEIEENLKEEIGLKIDIEEYFDMPKKERKKFRTEKEEHLDELRHLIECSNLDMAVENGYDSYEEYEQAMEWECMDDYC